jgi:3-dehydroquinate synthetase
MNQINVDIKQNNIKYKILFSPDILLSIKENIENYEKKRFLFVVDSKVYSLYKETLDEKISILN